MTGLADDLRGKYEGRGGDHERAPGAVQGLRRPLHRHPLRALRFERERTPAYCDLCREERKREQARLRMQRLRARRRPPYNQVADVGTIQ
jgi:hypothetical protein